MDIPRIAPCMPGAELTEIVDAQNFKGKISVRLGPVALAFAGRVAFDSIDEARHSARVTAQGSDAKGRGGANATATFRIEPNGPGSKVLIHTDLMLSGAVAQYGRGAGMIQATAAQIIGQFAGNLRAQLAEHRPSPKDLPSTASPNATLAPPAAPPISGLSLMAASSGNGLSPCSAGAAIRYPSARKSCSPGEDDNGPIIAAQGDRRSAALVALVGLAGATGVDGFYRGRNVTLVIGYSVGGGYDAYARLLARYFGSHVPGEPLIVPQQMVGAGSLRAANFIYSVAAKDGSVFGTFSRSMGISPLVDKAEFDSRKFTWLGSVTDDNTVCVTWNTSPVKTWDDFLKIPSKFGGEGAGADPDIWTLLYKNVFGAKTQLVSGYPGTNDACWRWSAARSTAFAACRGAPSSRGIRNGLPIIR
jgi:carbon monoxide dehydrogenase subunit G